MLNLKLLLASSALAGVLAASPYAQALSQSGDQDEELADALNRVAGESNIEILFAPELVDGRRINAAVYSSAPDAKLNEMLTGTGLVARETRPNVYVITDATSPIPASSTAAATSSSVAVATQQDPLSAPPVQQEGAPGSIEGRLTETVTGTGLAGAVIGLEGTSLSAVTDARGFFRLAAVPPGEYTLSADYIGAPYTAQRVRLAPGESLDQDLVVNLGGIDTITVTGRQTGFLQALNQQRNAENNRTVISADLLGTFPAESIAEALRRVPGVSFERDAATGEGNRVSVRGIFPDGINIQVNGLQLQGTGIDRAVDLTGFLADNVSQVTIQKSLLPENEGTANGGLIEIETRSALDYGERHFSVGIEREFGTDSDFGDEYQFNASAVTQLSDSFGIGANLQYRTSDRRNFDISYLDIDAPVLPAGFTSLFRTPFTFNYPFDDALPNRLVTGANYFVRDREVENWTGSVFGAWDVNDTTRLRLEYQRIVNEDASETRRTTASSFTTSRDMPIPELGGEVRRRTSIRAFRPTLGINETDTDVTTDVFSFRGDSTFGQWTLDYKSGYTRTERNVNVVDIGTLSDQASNVFDLFDPGTTTINPDTGGTDRLVDGVVSTFGDGIPGLNLTPDGQALFFDPDTYYVFNVSQREQNNTTEIFTGQFDAQYDFADRVLNYLKAGIKYDDILRTNSDDVLSNEPATALSYSRLGATRQFLTEFGSDPLELFSYDVIGAGNLTTPFFRSGTAQSIFDQVEAFALANPGSYSIRDNRVDPIENSGALSTAKTDEIRFAAYVQGEVEFGDFTATGGFRFEVEDITGNAVSTPIFTQSNGTAVDRNLLIDAGLVDFFDNSNTAEKFLPSFVATYRPGDNWVGRFAYNRTIFSPSITAINRPQTLVINQRATSTVRTAEIREGNPDLEPEINDNFEIGLERYFEGRAAYLKGAFFFKDISGNITNVTQPAEPADIAARVDEILAPLIALDPSLALTADTEYTLRRPVNGDGGQIYGIELEGATNLDFLPESFPSFLENIQILANVTWTEAEFGTNDQAADENGDRFELELQRPLANQAEWAGNVSVAYEDGPFSARLLYTYQSTLVTAYDEFNLNTVVPEFETLDFIGSYTLERGDQLFIFFVEADNLLMGTDDADVRSGTGSQNGQGSPDFFFPTTLQFNGGRTFTVGVKATF